jgi:heme a synthase
MDHFHLIQLFAMGAVVAAGPLAYVWAKADANKYRKLVWVTLFLTFDLIVFGGFTRLTDSGLGCPDWPGCYGKSNPLAAASEIRAAEAAAPLGPVTMTKATIEMIHRYLAMGVGALILTLLVLAWTQRRRQGESPWPATALFALVCIQGAFGAWTVTLKLMPAIVTIHLMLGLLLLAALTALAVRQGYFIHPRTIHQDAHSMGILKRLAITGACLLTVQIALGGWTSTNYAALACPDFPLCQGKLVPAMDFAEGFHLSRALGRAREGGLLPLNALTAIHWSHRIGAVAVFLLLGYLGSKLLRLEKCIGVALLVALTAQVLIGILTVVLGQPIWIATLHNAGAALLVSAMTLAIMRLWHQPRVSLNLK